MHAGVSVDALLQAAAATRPLRLHLACTHPSAHAVSVPAPAMQAPRSPAAAAVNPMGQPMTMQGLSPLGGGLLAASPPMVVVKHDFHRVPICCVHMRLLLRNCTAMEARVQVEVGTAELAGCAHTADVGYRAW